jgi:hypothetical protein
VQDSSSTVCTKSARKHNDTEVRKVPRIKKVSGIRFLGHRQTASHWQGSSCTTNQHKMRGAQRQYAGTWSKPDSVDDTKRSSRALGSNLVPTHYAPNSTSTLRTHLVKNAQRRSSPAGLPQTRARVRQLGLPVLCVLRAGLSAYCLQQTKVSSRLPVSITGSHGFSHKQTKAVTQARHQQEQCSNPNVIVCTSIQHGIVGLFNGHQVHAARRRQCAHKSSYSYMYMRCLLDSANQTAQPTQQLRSESRKIQRNKMQQRELAAGHTKRALRCIGHSQHNTA